MVVLDGSCGDYVINECTLFGEGLAQFDDDVSLDENGEQVALARPCTVQLEQFL